MLNAWADREMVDEFKRLMDADCLALTAMIGAPPLDNDATHYVPRLLELAAIGLAQSQPQGSEGGK